MRTTVLDVTKRFAKPCSATSLICKNRFIIPFDSVSLAILVFNFCDISKDACKIAQNADLPMIYGFKRIKFNFVDKENSRTKFRAPLQYLK